MGVATKLKNAMVQEQLGMGADRPRPFSAQFFDKARQRPQPVMPAQRPLGGIGFNYGGPK